MLNEVKLIGRSVADAELKYTSSGIAFCELRVAVDRDYKTESGEKITDFITVVCWKKTAEYVCQYVKKGRLVFVSGKIQIRQWTTEDGKKRNSVDIVVDRLKALDKVKTEATDTQAQTSYDAPQQADDFVDDYDPFAED